MDVGYKHGIVNEPYSHRILPTPHTYVCYMNVYNVHTPSMTAILQQENRPKGKITYLSTELVLSPV